MNIKTIPINKDFSYNFSFSINEILQDWSYIHHSNTYLTAAYLTAIEKSKLPYLSFVYVVVYHQQLPVGLMYFQCLEITNSFYSQDTFPNEIYNKITSKLLKRICGNLIMCGNFFATGVHGFVFNNNIHNTIAIDVVKSLKKELKNIETPFDTRFVMFKEFGEHQFVDVQKQLLKTQIAFEIDVNMVLDIDPAWEYFQDYLNSMSTKYRTRAKSVYKKTIVVQQKQLTAEEIEIHQLAIKKLYLSVINTANFNMVSFSDESFYQLKKALRDQFIFTAYFVEDTLVAFSTACFTDKYLDANYVGIDYLINETIPLYQRVLYDYVQLAIKNNVKELRLGRTAEIMKSSLGAKPIAMTLYLKHTNKLVNTMLKPLLKKVKPSEYELRKPFKLKKHI